MQISTPKYHNKNHLDLVWIKLGGFNSINDLQDSNIKNSQKFSKKAPSAIFWLLPFMTYSFKIIFGLLA